MARSVENDSISDWDVVSSSIMHEETYDKVDNILVPPETSSGPSGSRPPFTLISDPPHTERSNSQAAGGTLNVATGSTAQGQRTDDGAIVKIPEPASQAKRTAHTNDKSAKSKGVRPAPKWQEDEIIALLVLKLEALVRGVTSVKPGANWSNLVSKQFSEKHGFDRASKSCQLQWDTLLMSFNDIKDHESKIHSGVSSCVSFWKMDEHERSKNEKLPQVFYMAWYVLMESIIHEAARAVKKTPPVKGTTSIQVGANLQSSCTHFPSTITNSAKNISLEPSDANRSPSSSHDQVSTIDPLLASNLASTQGSQQLEDEVLGMPDEILDMPDDHLISRIAPFVNKQIEDAFKPLTSILRGREEVEQRHRDKMLAIEKDKLALMREKMLITQRGVTNSFGSAGSAESAQAGATLNFAASNLGQGEHADDHAEVEIMQDPLI